MPEAPARDLIVTHFDDQDRLQRLPLTDRSLLQRLGPPGALAGEAGRPISSLQLLGQLPAVPRRNSRGEPDVVEQALIVVEAEQERPTTRFFSA